MRSNKSAASLQLNQSLAVRQLASPTHKKVEGFDSTALSTSFSGKVERLRQKPKTEAVEEQYIRGLQDEIKYLEMELKLLQEKDLERHGQIDQLEKFFGDGIPINENILAIKNGFNNYKATNEKKIKDLATEKQERALLIDGLTHKIDKLLSELNEKERGNREAAQAGEEAWWGLVGEEAALRKAVEKEEEQAKAVKLQNRRLFEKIEKLTRSKLIENISVLRYENNKNSKLAHLRECIAEREDELLELEKQYGGLLKEQEEKGYIMRLEEQNLANRKRIIALERDHDNTRSKIKERAMELEERLRQRMAELHAKLAMRNKLDDLKQAIARENGLTVESVAAFAKEQEVEHLRRIIDANRKTLKYTEHYSSLLANIETAVETLAQRKPEVKSEIAAYSLEVARLRKRMQEERDRQVRMHAEMVQLQEKFAHCRERITPLQQRTKKNNDQIQAFLAERHRLNEEIKIKEKQLELIFVLKGLSFEEVEMSKSSNRNIQEEVVSFLKNWDKIQRNA